METKYTKGEWDYGVNANNVFDVFKKGSIKTIAIVLTKDVSYMPTREEAEANSKLIAAAPDMLEALNSMKIHFKSWLKQDENTIGYKHAVKALAAIEKATK